PDGVILRMEGGAARRRSGSKIRKLGKRWTWFKRKGGYLDGMPYYNFDDSETIKHRLSWCQTVWVKESKKVKGSEENDIRWRGIGCGERKVCPLCGSYRQLVLAQEAVDSMILAQTAVEVDNIQLESYGLKLVLTIPKTESARIDKLLNLDLQAWQLEVNNLFKTAYRFVARWFGDGCGGVVSMDFSGENEPAAAHYHINVYVFPARVKDEVRTPLTRWIEKDKLTSMRDSWTAICNNLFNIQLKHANFNVKYIDNEGLLHHWLQYLYRHSLSDLWRGWQGVDNGQVQYKANKNARVMELSRDDLNILTSRLGSIPAHFKRIRWFGIFSDGQRSKTMESFGLEAVDV
ncbi:unnamed protein product, partial [marine sediment metagenome]